MTNNQNPSQEEPKKGVFGSIQGAKSRDPEVAEEPTEATKTTEPKEPAKETPPAGEAVAAGDERLNKAAQRIAQLERQISQLGGWAQFGMAVGNDEQGKALVDRYQRGEKLFIDDDGEISGEPATPAAGEKALTRQELIDYMQQEKATDRLMSDLNSMAEEELPKFKEISRNSEYSQMLDWARQAAWRGTVPLDTSVMDWDNDVAAKEYTAIKKAYSMLLASNPKVLEAAKKAGEKQQKERDAEAAAVPSPTGTTTTSSQEEPEELSDAEKLVDGMLKARGRGKSFASIGGGKR